MSAVTWQPIDSAPKDRRVLLWVSSDAADEHERMLSAAPPPAVSESARASERERCALACEARAEDAARRGDPMSMVEEQACTGCAHRIRSLGPPSSAPDDAETLMMEAWHAGRDSFDGLRRGSSERREYGLTTVRAIIAAARAAKETP